MKLYIKTSLCEIAESVNGEVMIIETDNPIYLEDGDCKMELFPSDIYEEFELHREPFLVQAPENFSL